MATLLWPDNNQSQARTYLRNELSILNRTLGGAWLAIDGETIGLRPGVALDVTQFQQQLTAFEHLALAQAAFAQPDGATSQRLSQAIALYRDDFLLGFTLAACPDFDEWQFFQTESLRQRLAGALIALVAPLQDQHAAAAAIPHARRWLALDPLHEPAHQTLMRLYALSGRQAAALRQFDECQRILQEELGVEPAAETVALAVAIRTKQLGPAAPVTGIAAVDRPVSISAADEPLSQAQPAEPRPLFVGRESPLANLAQALAQAQRGQGQVRIITGEAGAGKSALVAEFLYRTAATSTALLVTVGACDAQTGVVAHHYQVAGVTQKAIDYLIVAGVQTRGLAANDEAVKHFSQAQRLLATLPARAVRQQQAFEVQFNLGQLLTLINGVGSQAADLAYRQALALARQVGDGYQLAQVLQNLASDAIFLSKLSLAQRYAEECLRLAEASQAPEL